MSWFMQQTADSVPFIPGERQHVVFGRQEVRRTSVSSTSST